MKSLTIFTPTYNRARLLPRLYDSLLQQNSDDFVWMVVNDGSTDNTYDLVQGWINEQKIPITYYFQENGGKMKALNLGTKSCQTPFFFCVDSDDYLTDGAINDIIAHLDEIISNENICGLIGKKWLLNNYPFSTHLPPLHTVTRKGLMKTGFRGETAAIYKTDVIRKYPFPSIEGEKYISLSYCYDMIDKEYVYRLVDTFWMICEYQPDGYSANRLKLKKENPKFWALSYSKKIKDNDIDIIEKIKFIGHYLCFCQLAGYSFKKTADGIGSRVACVMAWPLGVIYKWRLQIRYWNKYTRNG